MSVEAVQFATPNANASLPSVLSTPASSITDMTLPASPAEAAAETEALVQELTKEAFVESLPQPAPLPVPEPFRKPDESSTRLPAWMTSQAPIIRQPLVGLRMEDPSLPLPRFSPTKRKMRPEPIDTMAGIERVMAEANARFDESVEVAFNLGTDPRRGDQQVRGAVTVPYGTGKTVRVGVFADGEAAELARTAGAEVVGGEDLVAKIQAEGGGSSIPFDKCLATPDMMPKLARIARILGPRGLMPNPKLGTLVSPSAISDTIQTMKAGRVEYRADRTGVLHAAFGKCSFHKDHLYANLGALTAAVLAARPKGLKGGGMTGYILKATLSSTMGRAVPITLSSLQQAVAAATKR
ncbi:50S ribosomal protein L1 [Coccomyxa sp. Obi]|nr:50S ribosomal protein L1 [Coccomyxa sp. Obi]